MIAWKLELSLTPNTEGLSYNDAYLSFAEHYQAATMPAGVRKPKQKPGVEGSVGKVARKVIGMLRYETSHPLEALSRGIMDALAKLNSKGVQKRNGSRKVLFETEEKPMLRALPLTPFEICEWIRPGQTLIYGLKKGNALFPAVI